MYTFIWKDIPDLTENYHSDGAAVITAENLDEAYVLLRAGYFREHKQRVHPKHDKYVLDESSIYKTPPDVVYQLHSTTIKPEVFIFPNAGCC
jgi:hypothetical protein